MTKEEVKEYINNYISHIISMVEYGNWFAEKINQLVKEIREKIEEILDSHEHCHTKKACKEVLSEIDKELELLEENIKLMIDEELESLIDSENEWLESNVEQPLGLNFKKPSNALSMLKLIPIATAGIVGVYGKSVADRLRSLYEQKVMQSYVTGTDFEDIDFEARFNTFERGLQADSETLGSSLSGQYDRIVFTKNDNQIKGYMWLAILDSHTCIVCGEMDHKIFKKAEDIPIFPYHTNCRCRCILITEEIEKDIPESYEQWFENQSPKEKYQILGKKRFELYENGLKIKNFVNNGKITPLKDLKK